MHLVISDLQADVGPEIVSYPPDLIKAVLDMGQQYMVKARGHVCRVPGDETEVVEVV